MAKKKQAFEYFGRRFTAPIDDWRKLHKLLRNDAAAQAQRLTEALDRADNDKTGEPFADFFATCYAEGRIYPEAVLRLLISTHGGAWHSALAKEAAKVSDRNRDNAKHRGRQPWAIELAEELAASFDKFPAAWASIEEDGLKVFREGDWLRYAGRETYGRRKLRQQLKKGTFRTEYFGPALKKLKRSAAT